MAELYRDFRPRLWKHVIGQSEAVKVLREKLESGKLPHVLLLAGGTSGCGKTTCARILIDKLKCKDVTEINAASSRGIDTVREIEQSTRSFGMLGKIKVFVLDEAHMLTRASNGDAQTALLKVLEDCPNHVYFFLCTTHPDKLLPTILTRCVRVNFRALPDADVVLVIKDVCERSKTPVPSDAVLNQIASCAGGSGRMAVQLLEKVIGLKTEQEQLDQIQPDKQEQDSFELVKNLMNWGGKTSWDVMSKILKEFDGDPEGFRQLTIKVLSNEMLKGGKSSPRAQELFWECFRDAWHYTGKSGMVASFHRASLIADGKLL
jgi:DNA polymerase III gamma/tau subunit